MSDLTPSRPGPDHDHTSMVGDLPTIEVTICPVCKVPFRTHDHARVESPAGMVHETCTGMPYLVVCWWDEQLVGRLVLANTPEEAVARADGGIPGLPSGLPSKAAWAAPALGFTHSRKDDGRWFRQAKVSMRWPVPLDYVHPGIPAEHIGLAAATSSQLEEDRS